MKVRLNGRLVDPATLPSRFHEIAKSGRAPGMFMGHLTEDWSSENGGRGRRIAQLSDGVNDVYARSPQDALAKGKAMGATVSIPKD